MIRFIFKRLCITLPLLLGITFITFIFIQLAPGDFFDTLRLNPQISEETLNLYKQKFNLDKPMLLQYLVWLKNMFKGEWGYSFAYKAPVLGVIASRAFNTFLLSLSAIIATWLFVIPLGVIVTLHHRKAVERVISFFSYVAISSPSFFIAFLLLYGATYIRVLPLGGMHSLGFDEFTLWGKVADIAKHLVIPTIALSVGSIASLQRVMKANLLDVLGSEYILAAKARGLSNRRILYIHALKNAFNPMITIFGYQFSGLLSGAALIEIITGWPGLGSVLLEAVRSQDLYLVMGAAVIGGVMLIIGNLLADIMLAAWDPRIRYEKSY